MKALISEMSESRSWMRKETMEERKKVRMRKRENESNDTIV
jgi:hypothetical protein